MTIRRDDVDERAVERALDRASRELAERFGVVADVFGRWREPELARAVLESVVDGDGRRLADLVGPLPDVGLPSFQRCFWWQELIEGVASSPETRRVCRLRQLLTREERRLYIAIALESCSGDGPVVIPDPDGRHEIPPGECRDRLVAAGLAVCTDEPVSVGAPPVLGPPQYGCVGWPPEAPRPHGN